MDRKFSPGQRVRIVRVDDIPYGQKYSFLEATLDKTGVIEEIDDESRFCLVRLDDGTAISLTAGCLEPE
jgi:hypothetical protein